MKFQLTPRHASAMAVTGIVLTLAALVAGYWLNSYGYGGAIQAWYHPLAEALPTLGAFLVGGLIAARQPRNVYGWLWLLAGWGAGVIQPWGALLAARAMAASPPQLLWGGVFGHAASLGWLITLPIIPLTLLLFPTGRPPSARWQWAITTTLTAIALAALLAWAIPGPSGTAPIDNPFGRSDALGRLAEIVAVGAIGYVLAVIFPASALSLFVRYRRAGSLERTQIRWLFFSGAANVLFLSVDSTEIHRPWISEQTMTLWSNALLATLPLAVALAVLRYRLYDIDLIIRKTLLYAVLTALLALVYFGSVVTLQGLLEAVSDGRSAATVVFSTLLIAALFTPLRRRVQATIDRRFYRRRYDAARVLAAYSQVTRDEMEIERLTASLLQTVSATMQPTRLALWLREQSPSRE